jgi:hypothetical protein
MPGRSRVREALTLSAVLAFIFTTAIFFTVLSSRLDYVYAWITGPSAMVIGLGLIVRCRPGR